MRRILTAIAIFCLITLTTVSNFCVGDSDTIRVDAFDDSVRLSFAASYDFPKPTTYYVTLNGTWYPDETEDHPQDYVVAYYRPAESASEKSEILVVGEEYTWNIMSGAWLYLYFPDPDNIWDNHGYINVTLKYLGILWFVKDYVNVSGYGDSVSIANAKKHTFASGGEHELTIDGEWHYLEEPNDAHPQDYVLAYYSDAESERSEILGKGPHTWTVGSEAVAYFYMPDPESRVERGYIDVEINAIQDQGLAVWWLDPVWIAIWVAIISLIVAVIGVAVSRKVRE